MEVHHGAGNYVIEYYHVLLQPYSRSGVKRIVNEHLYPDLWRILIIQ
jgi:hypothetical protein